MANIIRYFWSTKPSSSTLPSIASKNEATNVNLKEAEHDDWLEISFPHTHSHSNSRHDIDASTQQSNITSENKIISKEEAEEWEIKRRIVVGRILLAYIREQESKNSSAPVVATKKKNFVLISLRQREKKKKPQPQHSLNKLKNIKKSHNKSGSISTINYRSTK